MPIYLDRHRRANHAACRSVFKKRREIRGARKIIRTRGHFPSDEAATKLMWLALRNIMVDSGRSVREWRQAMNQFAIAFGDRFTRYVV